MPLDSPKSKTYCPVLYDTIYSSNKDDSYGLCCYANSFIFIGSRLFLFAIIDNTSTKAP